MRAILAATLLGFAFHAQGWSVTVTQPTNGTTFAIGAFFIQAAPTAPDHTVTRVDFYLNGAWTDQDTNAPYTVLVQDLAPGTYRVVARAYNSQNLYKESAAVYVRVGNPPLQLVRGPYLQAGSATNMIVRWRTSWFANTTVRFGTNPAALNYVRSNATAVIDHEIDLTGLSADTVYYYSVGSSTQTLAGGSSCYFRTAPLGESPVRIWVLGDSGTSDSYQAGVRDAYYATAGAAQTDLLLMLGDNAYGEGLDGEYQTAVFDMYGDLLRHTPVWPTIGNHDAGDSPGEDGNQARDYLEIFSLPKNGESGGLPSGTELYYSFDYANIHVICLDSFLSDNSTNSPMLTWLRNDLASTEKDWIIAYWHHPPYSFGTHESDGEQMLAGMRERVGPVLEEYGVDLVLSGHSHNYERSFLLDGHYGSSWTLTPSMILNSGYGRTNVDGAYLKPAGGLGSHRGCVYVVCGCSGAGGLGEGYPLHPAMKLNHGGFGSMILQINGLRLDAQFLRETGVVDDYFTIDKSLDATNRPALAIHRGTNGATISWPTSKPAYSLHAAGSIPHTNWLPTASPAVTNGRRKVVTVPLTNGQEFFELRSP
jgi:hypothetical protein